MAGQTTIADQAHDILIEENVFQLYDEARDRWAELYEYGIEYDDPADTAALLDEIRDINARLEALVPAIMDYASRAPERWEYNRAVVAGEIEPPPEEKS